MEDLHGFRNEFEMTCAAQDGDGKAWMALYSHYESLMMSRLIAVQGIPLDELKSEAVDVFVRKLELFKREKVSSEDAYSMFSWLWCGAINRTAKLIRQREADVHLYFENMNDTSFSVPDENSNFIQERKIGVDDSLYLVYSPERIVVESIRDDDADRVKAFYARLSQFERNILEARREGLTLAEVAKKFCCSITTVKNHLRIAKKRAGDVFQVCYA
jgi:DNA-directed RNA polymerase specialized sigma24 family protein